MSLLQTLWQRGQLRSIDHALAQTLHRLRPDTPDLVAAAAALASLAVAQGHAAFDPAQPSLFVPGQFDWPDPEAWRATLRASQWVQIPCLAVPADPHKPLMLEHGVVYLRRYRQYEQDLADGLRRLARTPVQSGDLALLAPLFATLFPHAKHNDLQARAAALALQQNLLLISGAPGTGKTSVIARILLLLAAQHRLLGGPAPRIALAAPTGRAAERMAQSLRMAMEQLRALPGVDRDLCDALPSTASTLHRLLGPIPDSVRFRHNADHPLPLDVLVVDEASMIDLPMMCKLVQAIADGTQLIVLGDPDQLPSVEAGDVLAAIGAVLGDGQRLPHLIAQRLRPLLGESIPNDPDPTPLGGHGVRLLRGYRQTPTLALAPLAQAVREGDAQTALRLLRSDELAGVHFHANANDPLQGVLRAQFLQAWHPLLECRDPAVALRLGWRQRLLTPLREGAQELNARIEEALAGPRHPPYFPGRLLMIEENSPRHGLYNGDLGVCVQADDGALAVWFEGSQGPRAFAPGGLPAHRGAFAATVHKAQGSEFDFIWLLLPHHASRAATREMVYTAITRARNGLHICASADALRAALSQRQHRIGGLARRFAT